MFLFVDRILELEPGRRAVGLSHMSSSDAFLGAGQSDPLVVRPCLLGEAVGQLASWTVMASNDFTLRPMGGLVRTVNILGEARRGDPVLLDIAIDDVGDDSIVYHGVARVRSEDVFSFESAYCPLMPVADFDDPEGLRRHLQDLLEPEPASDPAVVASPYAGARPIDFDFDRVLSREPGREIVAIKSFDGTEPFFADHFPRKPVVPLTVVMECLLRLSRQLFAEGSGDGVSEPVERIQLRNAKITRFIRIGDSIVATVRLEERSEKGALFRLRCDLDGRRVCQARVEFFTAAGGPPGGPM